ncbi:transcription repressor NadR [Anaerosporobacter sp.]|uniref:transcription repressor NadR n=1 Tax=Anaerosporobacter sp. TaxID=1872529 RepID=UPI00286F11AB|nr:transcription repressor NadR [Anaerosporobacter sp.]
MEGPERREKLIAILEDRKGKSISGSEIARELGVSRQIIVQDIALLRAANKNIVSTTKGYLLHRQETGIVSRCFLVRHSTEQIEDELCTIVDHGGKILDVIVRHDIYGEIRTDLIISNREDVYAFVKRVNENQTVPLKELTDGTHLHTVEASNEYILDSIEEALRAKDYLV